MKVHLTMALAGTLASLGGAAQEGVPSAPISDLAGTCRNGQVFLTWKESTLPPGSTLSVYAHSAPISAATLPQARRLAADIDAGSARDWWQDPASFSKDATRGVPAGWVVQDGQPPLDPSGGLFVHTVTPETAGQHYYAVTWTPTGGSEVRDLAGGRNVTPEAIMGTVSPPRPIWQPPGGALPVPGSCVGRRLVLSLHGRGGGVTAGEKASAVNCLWFGDATQGWREGLAFKFVLTVQPDMVVITPMDRAWIGRPVRESKDQRDHCPAINTWWFGYNAEIRRTTQTAAITAPNYTERYLLALLRWAQRDLGCDANATYVKGGSMGGSGAVALALHFPDVFAAVHALVPVYSCTRPGAGSATRLECMCGPLAGKTAVTANGVPLLDYFNGARNLGAAVGDTPPIFATNGRTDGSIPWENNPPFYTAANAARQAFAVYWNNGAHGMSDQAPADVKAWGSHVYRYRLDASYPAFSDGSDNRRFGQGDPADGDLEGWINRGLDWQDVEDTPETYAITLTAAYPGIQYPVTVSVTPRRVQRFRPAPGSELQVDAGDGAPRAVTVAPSGLFTVPGIRISGPEGTRLVLRRR